MIDKNLSFMEEHIFSRTGFDKCLKEKTIQDQANKAFYSVWTNYIFNNPTTENLRDLKPENFQVIKKLSYGAKNRLQSYIAYNLNKDHYDFKMHEFTENESIYTIEMCREIFEDTKILVDWWRNPLSNEDDRTGEEWFQASKEAFQDRKRINRVGFLFINLDNNHFLKISDAGITWEKEQKNATILNFTKSGQILDQNLPNVQSQLLALMKKTTGVNNLKGFHTSIETNAQVLNLRQPD